MEAAAAGALVAGSVAAFPAAAVRPAAAARRGAGNGAHARGSRGHIGCYSRRRAENQRTDRLRAGARVLRVRLRSDRVGEHACFARALAADFFHAMERATDLFAAN